MGHGRVNGVVDVSLFSFLYAIRASATYDFIINVLVTHNIRTFETFLRLFLAASTDPSLRLC